MSASERLSFETYDLDIDKRELRRDGAPVNIEPQVFDLLVYVVRNRDRVVSKDDLVEAIWNGRAISDSTLTTRINAIRKALGDSGEEQRLIRTVARKGIRFVGAVTEGEPPVASVTAIEPLPLILPDKPSIAVLSFQNMSGDPEQEYFADGMVEEIITALSRFHWLFVIARNSTFTYKGRAVDIKHVARELGVRYVLEGSVRKVGQKVRITGQLIDGASGANIWADRFDGVLEDIFDLQDQMTISVVGTIEPKLRQAEIERARRKPTSSLDAYDHLLRAYAYFNLLTSDGNARALDHLNQALKLDPLFSGAAGLAAWCYLFRRAQGWVEAISDEAKEGCRLARIVAEGERVDAMALAYAAQALAYLGRDYAAALALIDRALQLNTNSFQIWNINGWLRLYTHDPESALASFQRAHRLNPLDPLAGTMMAGLSNAHWFLDNFPEALRWARLAVQANPNFLSSYMSLIQALVATSAIDEARTVARHLLRIDPTQTLSRSRERSPFQRPELLHKRIEMLRAAGIPE